MDTGYTGDESPGQVGRIPEVAAKATVIILYILALSAATLRTLIRIHYRKMQWLDDGFLVAAVVLMTIGIGLFFAMANDLYLTEALIYDTVAAFVALDGESFVTVAERVQVYTLTYNIICITGVFSIKFSFMMFFQNLLSRIRGLVIYWRCVVAYTAIAWAFSLGFSVFGCPYVDARALQCAQGPELWKAIDASIVLIVLDISTDLLIISVPLVVLKHVKLPIRKKFYLGGSLCLSAVMVVVAILQAATLTWMGVQAIDVVWEIYFQFVELTLAIMVVSITAFRAFFVQRGSRNQDSPHTSSISQGSRYLQIFYKIWPSSSSASRSNPTPQHPAFRSPPLSGAYNSPQPMDIGVHTVITHSEAEPAAEPAAEPSRRTGRFKSNAWLNQGKRPRVEPSTMSSVVDAHEEYHRIQRGIDHHALPPARYGERYDNGAAESPTAAAMAAADALDLETADLEAPGIWVPSTQGVTPISSSRSGTPPDFDLNPPSPVSPMAERRSQTISQALPPPRPDTTLRSSGSRREALRSPDSLHGPSPLSANTDSSFQPLMPAPHPATGALRSPETPTEPISASTPSVPRRNSRFSHVAMLQRSRPHTPTADNEAGPSSASTAGRRSTRRVPDRPEMRESGLRRLISASLARASELGTQKDGGQE